MEGLFDCSHDTLVAKMFKYRIRVEIEPLFWRSDSLGITVENFDPYCKIGRKYEMDITDHAEDIDYSTCIYAIIAKAVDEIIKEIDDGYPNYFKNVTKEVEEND